MTDTISALGGASSVSAENIKQEVATAQVEKRRDNAAMDMGPQRLVIEPVSSHRYVYKVLDSQTGEVIRQLPTEHVEKMITDPAYEQGGLVKTSV
ncbi:MULTISPECIES: flagellar protein FlaG [unclassified Brevundimonas]|uniref:flagellar protein FlaG n=1 Tax=unclassified Brevundimonas TaxID=2622653 RepID=UPI0025BECEBB|nr:MULTISPECIES: flagellar protein FlaG [unclassified Brevundimonas]